MQIARREREISGYIFDAGCGCCDGEGARGVPTAEVLGRWRLLACELEARIYVCCISCAGDGSVNLRKGRRKEETKFVTESALRPASVFRASRYFPGSAHCWNQKRSLGLATSAGLEDR